jgi:predicted AAA+ superfamily ATPase
MIRDVVRAQRREGEQRLCERYVERDIPARALSHDLVAVITGPRRAGKSFFGIHRVREMGRWGYLNFDDERLVDLEDHDEAINALDSAYDSPRHLLLDEVQNLPRWELLVNRLQRQGYRLIVTGSNAHLLGSELATHLTGRHLSTVLFPFSFREYMRALDTEPPDPMAEYLENGGYPEPLLKNIQRREYLSTLVRSILYKDIVVRHRIRSPQGLEDLATHLVSNVAQEYSYHSLAQVSRLRSLHTVERYLRFLEEAFLFFSVRRFSFKVSRQTRSNRKIYCVDNGLVTSASFRFSKDLGKLYENLVAIALRKGQLRGDLDFYFWKGSRQEEVDFVVKRGLEVAQLIQVCLDVDQPKTRHREVRSLLRASRELGCRDLLVLTETAEREEKASWYGIEGEVRFAPLRKWLSEEDPR